MRSMPTRLANHVHRYPGGADRRSRSQLARAGHFEHEASAQRSAPRRSGRWWRFGALYARGESGSADPKRACALFARGCDDKHDAGCYNLGICFAQGLGGEKDLSRAIALYRRACDADDENGCCVLAQRYELGDGVPGDPEKAADYSKRACRLGLTRACPDYPGGQPSERPPIK